MLIKYVNTFVAEHDIHAPLKNLRKVVPVLHCQHFAMIGFRKIVWSDGLLPRETCLSLSYLSPQLHLELLAIGRDKRDHSLTRGKRQLRRVPRTRTKGLRRNA